MKKKFTRLSAIFLCAVLVVSAAAISPSAVKKSENKIYFDVGSTGWQDFYYIFCHIWACDGSGEWLEFGMRAERCENEGDGIWSYDLSKTGNEIKETDGKIYCVIFAADTGVETYNLLMSGGCIGDTAYVTGEMAESPENADETCAIAAWRNNSDCKAEKKITPSGNVTGTDLPDGASDESLLAEFLLNNIDSESIAEAAQTAFDSLGLYTSDVYEACVEILEEQIYSYEISEAAAEETLERLAALLLQITRHGDEERSGNINGDGILDINDATYLQMYLAGYDNAPLDIADEEVFAIVDFNGDESIDINDVTSIQIYLAGL